MGAPKRLRFRSREQVAIWSGSKKRDGLRPEQVLALVKSHLANAGGNRFETKSLNDDVIAHCIEEYYMPTVPLHLPT